MIVPLLITFCSDFSHVELSHYVRIRALYHQFTSQYFI